MEKFFVGQRVSFKSYQDCPEGTGTVRYFAFGGIGVEVDAEYSYEWHNLHGVLLEERGWVFPPSYVLPLEVSYSPTQSGDRDDDI